MTRINLVPPRELCQQHLVAEYKELPRVFGLVRRLQASDHRMKRGWNRKQPQSFTLGRGHLLFFYDKLQFLLERQVALIGEMRARGYTVNHGDPTSLVDGLWPSWFTAWVPTPADVEISRERIRLMMPERPGWKGVI